MRKVIVDEWMSLDGVGQAPGTSDEDPTGGTAGGTSERLLPDDGQRRSPRLVESQTTTTGAILARYAVGDASDRSG